MKHFCCNVNKKTLSLSSDQTLNRTANGIKDPRHTSIHLHAFRKIIILHSSRIKTKKDVLIFATRDSRNGKRI